MVYGEVGHSYVALARPEGAALVGKLVNTLKFTVKEIDPSTGESQMLLAFSCSQNQTWLNSCAVSAENNS